MSGHGHVTPNPRGILARCGGPGICGTCKQEWYDKYGAPWPYESEDAMLKANNIDASDIPEMTSYIDGGDASAGY
jgi:ferredoxin